MATKLTMRIVFHILAWSVISLVPLYFVPRVSPGGDLRQFHFSALLHTGMLIIIFYFNFRYLYPGYFKQNKIPTYVLLCILTALSFTSVYGWIKYVLGELYACFLLFVFVKSFIALAVIALSTFCRLVADTIREQNEQRRRETENLKTELSFLRSQVSPHFMFNVLNSLVAMIRQKSDQLEPVVIQLSNLMRYMLYESDEEKVSLKTEVEYLMSYVRMQLIRFSDDVEVVLDVQQDFPNRLIEPMLLIPIVENAFKHGVGMIDQPMIKIAVSYVEDELSLVVKNKFTTRYAQTNEKKNSGIGLDNLKKRLVLLYPDHVLYVDQQNGWFTVSLQIKIKSTVDQNEKALINHDE